jgi:hypothetical protein
MTDTNDTQDRKKSPQPQPAPSPVPPERVARGGRSPTAAAGAGGTGDGGATPRRWHAHHKREVVLRLFAGASLDALSRELGIPVSRLESWKHAAIAGMEAGLTVRSEDDPVQRRLDDANRRIGELTVENDILKRQREKNGPFPGRRFMK